MEEKTNARTIMMNFEEASELVDFITDSIYDYHRKSKVDEGSEFGRFLRLTDIIEVGKTSMHNIGIDSFAVKQTGNKLYVSKLTHNCWNIGNTDKKYSHLIPYLYILGLHSSDYPRINIQPSSSYNEKSMRFKDGFNVGEIFNIEKELCQGDKKLYSLEWDKVKIKNLFGLDAEHFEKLEWNDPSNYWMYVERNSLSREQWTPMILRHSYEELVLETPKGRERLYFDYNVPESFEGEMIKKLVKPKNLGNGVVIMAENKIPKYLQRVLNLDGKS